MLYIQPIVDPWRVYIKIDDVLYSRRLEEQRFLSNLPGAYFDRKAGLWSVSTDALHQIWEKFGMERCDWPVPPWELGLMEAPVFPSSYDPGPDETPYFRGELLDFQSESAAFLYGRQRAIVCDEAGLGKTITAIRALLKGRLAGEIKRAVVVTRSSTKKQWANEIARFTDLTVVVIHGDKRRREKLWSQAGDYDVVIINYEQFLSDIDFDGLQAYAPECIIFDEMHYLRGSTAKRTKRAVRFVNSKNGPRYVWGLTATPTTGKLQEIWSLFQFINPVLLGTASEFQRNFCILAFRHTAEGLRFAGIRGYKNKVTLRALVRPYMLTRKIKQVADRLPSVMVIQRTIEPSADQRKLLAQLEKWMEELEARAASASGEKALRLEEARTGALMLMSMAAADTELLINSESSIARKMASGIAPSSPKLEELVELATGWAEAGHKFIVFTEFVEMAHKIRDRLAKIRFSNEEMGEEVNLHVGLITGEIPSTKREEIAQAFRDCPHSAALVLDRAGQEGLNLQVASIVCLFDLPWSPTDIEQRLGRARRLESEHNVVRLYLLVLEDSIDERLLKVHFKKSENIRHLIDREDV